MKNLSPFTKPLQCTSHQRLSHFHTFFSGYVDNFVHNRDFGLKFLPSRDRKSEIPYLHRPDFNARDAGGEKKTDGRSTRLFHRHAVVPVRLHDNLIASPDERLRNGQNNVLVNRRAAVTAAAVQHRNDGFPVRIFAR